MIASIQSSLFERMVALRRDLHRHPELSGQERQTTDRLSKELNRLGIGHHRPLETGLVGEIQGPPGVPAVARRAPRPVGPGEAACCADGCAFSPWPGFPAPETAW